VTGGPESWFCPRRGQRAVWEASSNPEPGCQASGRRGAENTFRVVDTQLESRDMQSFLRKNKSQVHLTGNCADHTMPNHRGTVLLNQLHTGLLLRVRTFARGVPVDHSVASHPLRQLQPSPQATPYLLDATPPWLLPTHLHQQHSRFGTRIARGRKPASHYTLSMYSCISVV
jgi:hypothetical protein